MLGIDRFAAGHDRGSSHGETRIIRQAYFEHSNYVPLLLRAYELWADLEAACDIRLLHPVGLLQVGPPEGEVVPGVLRSAAEHRLAVEELAPAELQRRFPGFRIPAGLRAVFEPKAGYLRVESCVLAHLAAAKEWGAELKFGVTAHHWQANERGVRVTTDAGDFIAEKLILAAGPWASQLLHTRGIELQVLRKHVYWFDNPDQRLTQEQGCPTFFYELPQGIFYGFPQIDELGVKMAEHNGGIPVSDPLRDDRALDQTDLARMEPFRAEYLPGVSTKLLRHSVCYYTMSPDGHFVVDWHPASERVVFAAGLSGHGFKFTSVLGEALADLALAGETKLPIGFLGCSRLNASGG